MADVLGYQNCRQAIQMHVSPENKILTFLNCCLPQIGVTNKSDNRAKLYNLINEVGFYQLVFNSQLETAQMFRQWVFKTVLPSIRKYGLYKLFDNPHNKMLQICNETSLHYQIIKVIRRFYPHALLLPGLGELQDTSSKRMMLIEKVINVDKLILLLVISMLPFKVSLLNLKTPIIIIKLVMLN